MLNVLDLRSRDVARIEQELDTQISDWFTGSQRTAALIKVAAALTGDPEAKFEEMSITELSTLFAGDDDPKE